MTDLSQDILKNWQTRKNKAQKTAFIEMLQSRLPGVNVEKSSGLVTSRNLVLGNVDTAQVVYTAHYDTCARLPFPNFITPKNFLFYLLYQILIITPFILFMVLLIRGLRLLGLAPGISFFIGYFSFLFAMVYVFMLGPASKTTANDNTSGVITLVELYLAMTPQQRSKAAFVFFDNEENGLLGSSAFASRYKKRGIQEKLLVNFDCVSDGDHIMLVLKKKANRQYRDLFARCFRPQGQKQVLLETSRSAFYPSDQAGFAFGVGVCALKHKKGVGYYMDRIHTAKDRVFEEANVQLLVSGALELTDNM